MGTVIHVLFVLGCAIFLQSSGSAAQHEKPKNSRLPLLTPFYSMSTSYSIATSRLCFMKFKSEDKYRMGSRESSIHQLMVAIDISGELHIYSTEGREIISYLYPTQHISNINSIDCDGSDVGKLLVVTSSDDGTLRAVTFQQPDSPTLFASYFGVLRTPTNRTIGPRKPEILSLTVINDTKIMVPPIKNHVDVRQGDRAMIHCGEAKSDDSAMKCYVPTTPKVTSLSIYFSMSNHKHMLYAGDSVGRVLLFEIFTGNFISAANVSMQFNDANGAEVTKIQRSGQAIAALSGSRIFLFHIPSFPKIKFHCSSLDTAKENDIIDITFDVKFPLYILALLRSGRVLVLNANGGSGKNVKCKTVSVIPSSRDFHPQRTDYHGFKLIAIAAYHVLTSGCDLIAYNTSESDEVFKNETVKVAGLHSWCNNASQTWIDFTRTLPRGSGYQSHSGIETLLLVSFNISSGIENARDFGKLVLYRSELKFETPKTSPWLEPLRLLMLAVGAFVGLNVVSFSIRKATEGPFPPLPSRRRKRAGRKGETGPQGNPEPQGIQDETDSQGDTKAEHLNKELALKPQTGSEEDTK